MRRNQGRRSFVAGIAALALAAEPSLAQAPPADATTIAARTRFQEGVELSDKGQYEAARVSFQQALALKRHPVVLLNLGHCALRTNRPLEAKRYFEAFLSEGTSATSTQREEARKGATDAALKVPRIVVVSDGARRVIVDGVASTVGGRGFVVELEVGQHRFVLEGAGGAVLRDGERAFIAGESFELRGNEGTVLPASSVPPVSAVASSAGEPGSASAAADDPAPQGPTDGPRWFSAPDHVAPMYAGLGVGAAGTVGAILFLVAKQRATDNATATEALIRSRGGGRSSCSGDSIEAKFVPLCSALTDNYDAVDKDALFGNISLGVAVAGTAFGVGWWLFAPKKAPAGETGLVVTPQVDLLGSQKMFGLAGHF